jgi:hypothetical protein
MSPHCSAIFLQHSRSADVIAAPGNTQAATGSAASISASADTPTLINNLNITSLSTTDSKTQLAGKGFTLPPSRGSVNRSTVSKEYCVTAIKWCVFTASLMRIGGSDGTRPRGLLDWRGTHRCPHADV